MKSKKVLVFGEAGFILCSSIFSEEVYSYIEGVLEEYKNSNQDA